METAIAALLRFYKGNVNHVYWHNFWVNETINGVQFVNFQVSELMMNRSADEGGVTLTIPATNAHLQLIDTAIANEWLCEIQIIEMPANDATFDPSNNSSPSTVIAQFVGEVLAMQTDLTQIEVEIGTAMDAISGDIPGRKITTSLVGRLPSL
jgi:hypothetical protein